MITFVLYFNFFFVVFILYLPEDVLKSVLLFFKSTSVQKTLLARIRIYTFKAKRFKAFFKIKSLKFNIEDLYL